MIIFLFFLLYAVYFSILIIATHFFFVLFYAWLYIIFIFVRNSFFVFLFFPLYALLFYIFIIATQSLIDISFIAWTRITQMTCKTHFINDFNFAFTDIIYFLNYYFSFLLFSPEEIDAENVEVGKIGLNIFPSIKSCRIWNPFIMIGKTGDFWRIRKFSLYP